MGGNYLPLVDDEVIRKAQKADTDAFSQIYKAYYNKVYFIAYQYYKDDETAKDIVQEVFIHIHRKIKDLREPRTFAKWLSKITYSICVNSNRRKLKMTDLGEATTIEDFSSATSTTLSDDLEAKRVNEIIMKSLEMMTPPLKSVGMMRYYEELQIKEISQILKVPKGTVNSRLDRIRKILQQDLIKNGISPKNYSIAITPTLIAVAYRELSTQYTLAQVKSEIVLKTVLTTKAASYLSVPVKLLIGGVVSASVIGGVFLSNQPVKKVEDKQLEVEEVKPEVSEEPEIVKETASILDVSYDTNWTNKVIVLTVATTNDNYDQLLVNGIESNEIIENGEYHIEIIKDGIVLDQRDIIISTIDVHGPTATYSQNENVFTYNLSDDLSQINPTSIQFFKDGIESDAYDYNTETNILTIKSEGNSLDYFNICDYAGNKLEIFIQ